MTRGKRVVHEPESKFQTFYKKNENEKIKRKIVTRLFRVFSLIDDSISSSSRKRVKASSKCHLM